MVRGLMPFRETRLGPFEDLYKEVDQLVNHFFGSESGNGGSAPLFLAPVNVAESEGAFEVSVDLPGLKPEEVHVEINDGQLSISGERKSQTSEEGKTYHRVERRHGAFRRVIQLPTQVDETQIAAKYADGVLHVTLPKSEKVKPTRIEVTG